MITLTFIKQQLQARPFLEFTILVNSGDRYSIKTPDYADIPPVNQGALVVYDPQGIPRYLAVENITSLEMAST